MPKKELRSLSKRLHAARVFDYHAGSRAIRPHQDRPEKIVDRNVLVGETAR
jgi:hypothetical protein